MPTKTTKKSNQSEFAKKYYQDESSREEKPIKSKKPRREDEDNTSGIGWLALAIGIILIILFVIILIWQWSRWKGYGLRLWDSLNFTQEVDENFTDLVEEEFQVRNNLGTQTSTSSANFTE